QRRGAGRCGRVTGDGTPGGGHRRDRRHSHRYRDRFDRSEVNTPPNIELAPVTGAWRESDVSGDRRFCRIGSVPLESGARIDDVTMSYETWGTYDGSNAVLILHALTGDSHVAGPAGPGHPTPGWWDGLVGPECAIDTNTFFVVAANILGGCQGTTGTAWALHDGLT